MNYFNLNHLLHLFGNLEQNKNKMTKNTNAMTKRTLMLYLNDFRFLMLSGEGIIAFPNA